ncbi:hypothetical protein L484_015638 [Morus notabilis]|uniref:DYW domain-containing protein n=1 Tax=Morus notabilis TaxID=981085 RepID=W9R8P1_9ROSA|nr:pentatricopeptide repeat-containing protein At5g46460, mitochondrial [Morus notabilis]EXB58304.1 hypothetical protein L484_015638 [Morus notabilis]
MALVKSLGRFLGLMNYTKLSSSYNTKLSSSYYKSLLSDHLQNQRVDEARAVFDGIPCPGVNLYTIMTMGYVKNRRLDDALKLFDEIPVRDRDTVSWNSMMKGCLDCGELSKAKKIFDEMPERNVVSWTTMIHGFMRFGEVEMAERLFHKMPTRDIATWNSMIHGYFSNGRVGSAIDLFEVMPHRNVISWTSMIGGLDQNGKSDEALLFFNRMTGSGFKPTSTTLVCALTASANIFALHLGLKIHGQIVKLGYCFDEFSYASLITFYANCKQVEHACKVFKEKMHKNVAVWTALVTGYALNCEPEKALEVFRDMIASGVLPNQSSFTSALNACCGLEALDRGKEIHSVAIKLGMGNDSFVGNTLIVMYSKCGSINHGISVFTRTNEKNIVSWNSVIMGCAQHGYGMLALTLFSQMMRAGIEPDEITFTGLLSACRHSGMLQKRRGFSKFFSQDKTFEVNQEHYACMVDLLGRCGKLEEAEELVRNMPFEANSMVWLALLGACRLHSNLDVAERAAKSVFELDPHCSAAYVLLSNIYASANRWSDVSRVRETMKRNGIVKQPGSSWVTLKGLRHEFRSGDRSHPLSEKIYQKLDWLGVKLKEFGYVPDQQFALHDVEAEQKEEMLSSHSERLAIVFALVSTAEGSTITVMKNLRVCGDCHSAIKLIAKIVGREIVLRDSSRFHHFRNGICSCGDYW